MLEYVEANGRTILSVLDGVVDFENALGVTNLVSGEQANYPGVLDVGELVLSAAEERELAPSLTAYRSGDLLAALASYPDGRAQVSVEEEVYRVGLWLSVGRVGEAEALLGEVRGRRTEDGRRRAENGAVGGGAGEGDCGGESHSPKAG